MFSFSFAIVPLYSAICSATGLRTFVPLKELKDSLGEQNRNITIQLIAIKNRDLPWDFYPAINRIQVHPNTNTKVNFFAKNNTDHTMTIQAIPSMTPSQAIRYFHKIECFCFKQQTLKAGEEKNMALIFRVDSTLPSHIHTITLAYTLFRANT